MKPGILTTEFWISAAVAGISMLVGVGVVGPQDQPQLVEAAKAIVAGVVAVVTVVNYVRSRTALKGTSIEADLKKSAAPSTGD